MKQLYVKLIIITMLTLRFASPCGAGERLYNGIVLPDEWPPDDLNPNCYAPMPVPYLENVPAVIPVDVGRQLFVDDFLIRETTLRRVFHKAKKFQGNPVLKPQTALEMNGGMMPVAAPFSDGVFYDFRDGLFKIWYLAGFFNETAYATSKDGIYWERPELDIVPGTNQVIDVGTSRRDGVSVWLDHEADRPEERFKMLLYSYPITHEEMFAGDEALFYAKQMDTSRRPPDDEQGGRLFTSADGIHWRQLSRIGLSGDNTTIFYNPFRKKWVLSIRSDEYRPYEIGPRTRDYYEFSDFVEGAEYLSRRTLYEGFKAKNKGRVFWVGSDILDLPDADVMRPAQLYKLDAVAYESIMLGLFTMHQGPPNPVCMEGGFPKITQLMLGYSRDGFHWHRPERTPFIGATKRKGDWDRAYIHSAGGCCLVVGDSLYFYYGGWSGKSPKLGGHIYAGGSTGLAILRRDGFASMNADDEPGFLTTRLITFCGKYLFVNVDCPDGQLRAEIQDAQGNAILPFTIENCRPVSLDRTVHRITWNGGRDLSSLSGKKVRLRFELEHGQLYSFWISPSESGASYGYVAAGGPGFEGPIDNVGRK
ncbi:MAG TPA: glycosyl hydrolase family 32 [Planctomycetes bacterium]|nr:glycosyl hydrolase family 32 [Planctomycetota bacterium]